MEGQGLIKCKPKYRSCYNSMENDKDKDNWNPKIE